MFHDTTTRAFHAMAKPSGADCNLKCAYCFYLEKEALYPGGKRHRMNDAVQEAYIRHYIGSIRDEDEVAFTWQGGEPTLLGLDFYRRAVTLQARYGQGRRITNSFQTNGLLLDDAWCEFLAEHGFLVGLSLDGPAAIHDAYRQTLGGSPSHELVMRALRLLQRHGVQYNVLACVNRKSSRRPVQVYGFLREAGVEFMQFLPVVERLPGPQEVSDGLSLHGPDSSADESLRDASGRLTEWSVGAEDYGRFLTSVFDEWIGRDVGNVFVMNFEWALANFIGRPGAVCHHQPTCGRSVIVEHNGDVYACDHYVYPRYRLGNVASQSFASMLDCAAQEQFGKDKFTSLPKQCRQCNVLKGCWGGCPKHRFIATADGEPGLNYLCAGFRRFFGHTAPYLQAISQLLAAGRPAEDIMQAKLLLRRKTP